MFELFCLWFRRVLHTPAEIQGHAQTRASTLSTYKIPPVTFCKGSIVLCILSFLLLFLSPAHCHWRPDTPQPSDGHCIPSWSLRSRRTTDEPGCRTRLLEENHQNPTFAIAHTEEIQINKAKNYVSIIPVQSNSFYNRFALSFTDRWQYIESPQKKHSPTSSL